MPLGAQTPYQDWNSYPEGRLGHRRTFGASTERSRVAIASALIRVGSSEAGSSAKLGSMSSCTAPFIRSCNAGVVPRYGHQRELDAGAARELDRCEMAGRAQRRDREVPVFGLLRAASRTSVTVLLRPLPDMTSTSGATACACDHLQIDLGIEGRALQHLRHDSGVEGTRQQRVAIRVRLDDALRADEARASHPVLDDGRATELVLDALGDQTAERVVGGTPAATARSP